MSPEEVKDKEQTIFIEQIGKEVSQHHARELLATFNSPGWRILTEIWIEEEQTSIDLGMALASTEAERAPHRGVYHKLQDLKCLPGNVQYCYDKDMGMLKDPD